MTFELYWVYIHINLYIYLFNKLYDDYLLFYVDKKLTTNEIIFEQELLMNQSSQTPATTSIGCHHKLNTAKTVVINDTYFTRASNLKKEKAFTLIELIITIAIIAIIAAIATPYIITQLAAAEAKRMRYSISNTLSLAKAESLIRRQNLLVCLSDDSSTCDKNSNSVLILFADNDDNKNFDADVDLLLNVQELNPKYATLHLRASGRNHIKFFGDTGMPRGHFGHIKYCPSSTYNNAKYQVSFSQVGIIRYKPNSSHPTDCD